MLKAENVAQGKTSHQNRTSWTNIDTDECHLDKGRVSFPDYKPVSYPDSRSVFRPVSHPDFGIFLSISGLSCPFYPAP